MKKNELLGTICASIGIVFAAGGTIVCGLIALVCMGAALCAFRYAERKADETSMNISKTAKRIKAA